MVTKDPCDPVFKVFIVRTLQPGGKGCRRTSRRIFSALFIRPERCQQVLVAELDVIACKDVLISQLAS